MKRQAVSMSWCVQCVRARVYVLEYVCYDSIHVLVHERKSVGAAGQGAIGVYNGMCEIATYTPTCY